MFGLIAIDKVFDKMFADMFINVIHDLINKANNAALLFFVLKVMRKYLEKEDEHQQQRVKKCFGMFVENVNAIRNYIYENDMKTNVYLICCDFILSVFLFAKEVYWKVKEVKMIKKIIQEGIEVVCELEKGDNSVKWSYEGCWERKEWYVMFLEGGIEERNGYEDIDGDLRDVEFKEGMKVWYNGKEYSVFAVANEKVGIEREGKGGKWVDRDDWGLMLLKNKKKK